tara:strand:- start:19 stop:243 length:225 start_codon:yes stop_codon:yes gene_type:complete
MKNSVLSKIAPQHKRPPKIKKGPLDDGLGHGWFGTLYRANKHNRRKKIAPITRQKGGKISKYYSDGGNVITGRD